ncbi:unnamed protein product [Sphacelaria rigidula]
MADDSSSSHSRGASPTHRPRTPSGKHVVLIIQGNSMNDNHD